MREPLIDLCLLTLLVLFFGIQQRHRPEGYFRAWLVGWLLVLASVVTYELKFLPTSPTSLLQGLGLNVLECGGLWFVFSFVWMQRKEVRVWRYGVAVAIAASLVTDIALLEKPWRSLLCIFTVFGHGTAAVATGSLLPLRQVRLRYCLWLVCSIGLTGTLVLVLRAKYDWLPDVVLAEIFFAAAILFGGTSVADRAGRTLGTAGFLGWAAGYLLDPMQAWLPKSFVDFTNQVWTLPKHVVGFGMIVVLFNTSKKEAEDLSERYRGLYREFRLLYEHNPHPMWVYEFGTGKFLSANEAATRQYGYSEQEFRKMSILEIRPAEDIEHLHEVMLRPENLRRDTWRHKRKDGSIFEADVTGHDIVYEGTPARFVLAIDVSERQELQRKLEHRAQHDVLTGLPNRRVMEERLAAALQTPSLDGYKTAVLTIDVDRFKLINDTMGHPTGDECLKEIAKRLRSKIRRDDTIARTGGEEFTAVIGRLSSPQDLHKVTDMLLQLFVEPIRTPDHEFRISVSIGAAVFPDDGMTSELLRTRSDQALYHAKRNGGDQVVFASEEVYAPLEQTRNIESRLRLALRDESLQLYYQPIVDGQGRLQYFEALLRSLDPELDLIGPAAFIPVAEECNVIGALWQSALTMACRQSNQWMEQGTCAKIAVNVSAKQLRNADFTSEVLRVLQQCQVPFGALSMELTETAVMGEHASVAAGMASLSSAGVEFAIDDFGTGYSSLARLNKLPLSSLKIDRSFVQQIDESGARTIIIAVIQMAKNLGLKVVAEGVETGDQFTTLRDLGCDLFQGYHFARPLPPEEAAEWLACLAPEAAVCRSASSRTDLDRMPPLASV